MHQPNKSGRPTLDEKDADLKERKGKSAPVGTSLVNKGQTSGASCYTKQIKDLSSITSALVYAHRARFI